MALTASERETTINMVDDLDHIVISTSQRVMVTQLLNNPNATITEDVVFDGTRMLTATLPLGSITVRKAAKGSIRRDNGGKKREITAARCGTIKEDGKPCKAIAAKATGSCPKHPAKV
jgi:hypothetical protein